MALILSIETSTALCSAALALDGKVICYKESTTPRSHASLTSVFADEVLRESGKKVADLDAICVSMGPGSYTGLRVGVSTAKGLCFGARKPLLAVGTLDTIVAQAVSEGLLPEGAKYVVPMVDARRMEVYTAVFTSDGRQLTETEPKIIDEDSFSKELAEGPVLFVGDGAEKCAAMIHSGNAVFAGIMPKASAMAELAEAEFAAGRFRDVAYFEPFYLKDFVATVSKKKLF